MPFYLPRRHRRKLLFPPGLLALAGLLWLGCAQLGAHPERLKQQRVMSLTMLPLERFLHAAHYFYENTWPEQLSSPGKAAAFRPWREVQFTDNANANAEERAHLTTAALAIIHDKLHDGGVRVRFSPVACYGDLVFTLDLMNRVGIKKYWLDIQHGPATLYAITYTDVAPKYVECEGVGVPTIMYEQPESLPLQVQLSKWAMEFWQFTWLKPLTQLEWRPSLYLFAAITLLSIWRMVRSFRLLT